MNQRLTEQLRTSFDLEHPMAVNHRLAIQNQWLGADYGVPLILVINKEESDDNFFLNNLTVIEPTEREMLLLVDLSNAKLVPYNSKQSIEEMKRLPLDMDVGINTTRVAKTRDFGWIYRNQTWRDQMFYPNHTDKHRFDTVEELILNIKPSSMQV